MITRRQAIANIFPPRKRRPPASKDLPVQSKKSRALKNLFTKIISKARTPVKDILKKSSSSFIEFIKLSLDSKKILVLSSPLVFIKLIP